VRCETVHFIDGLSYFYRVNPYFSSEENLQLGVNFLVLVEYRKSIFWFLELIADMGVDDEERV